MDCQTPRTKIKVYKKTNKTLQLVGLAFIAALQLISLPACFNVDKTQKIQLNKHETKLASTSPEEALIQNIPTYPLPQWPIGKTFYAIDNRASLIFNPRNLPPNPLDINLESQKLTYIGTDTTHNAAGQQQTTLKFQHNNKIYLYNTSNPHPTSVEIPMLVDHDIISQINQILQHKKLWIKTTLWYDSLGNTIHGNKYWPVQIDSVITGRRSFPLQICFTPAPDSLSLPSSARLYMTIGSSGADSRPFHSLFNIVDPHTNHPNIDNDTWTLIQHEQIRNGMTKDECRLALGAPVDVFSGTDPGFYYDLWQYPNGKYIKFRDGLLFDYK